jgi:hypothetical protein
MIMAAVGLLQDNPTRQKREIRDGISGNFCRCTGYQHIVMPSNTPPGQVGRGKPWPHLPFFPSLWHARQAA